MAGSSDSRRRSTRARRRSPGRAPLRRWRRDCALFLDIDGTLVELRAAPDAVRVDADARARCCRRCDASWAARSRSSPAARSPTPTALFPRTRAADRRPARPASGATPTASIHRDAPPERDAVDRMRRALAALGAAPRRAAARGQGRARSRCITAARPQLASARAPTLRRSFAHAATGVSELQPGKRLLEIQPDGRDKGTAIVDFMAEPPFRGPPAGVRRRRPDRRARLRRRRARWAAGRSRSAPGRTAARYRLPDARRSGAGCRRPWRRLARIAGRRPCAVHPAHDAASAGTPMRNLDLALIGNGRIGALVDARRRRSSGAAFRASTATRCSARCSTRRRRTRRRGPVVDRAGRRRARPSRPTSTNTAVLVDAAHTTAPAASSRSPTACRASCSTAACSSR